MAQGNPFGGLNAQTAGLTPPDFSIHNQFANAQKPIMASIGGGSPFALSPGAAAAASSLPSFGSGQFGQSGSPQLGGSMSNGAIGQAAQKLMQAADKLIQAADRLMGGRGGGGTGTGGPSFGGQQGLGGQGQPTLGGQGFVSGGMSYGPNGPSFGIAAGKVGGGIGLAALGTGGLAAVSGFAQNFQQFGGLQQAQQQTQAAQQAYAQNVLNTGQVGGAVLNNPQAFLNNQANNPTSAYGQLVQGAAAAQTNLQAFQQQSGFTPGMYNFSRGALAAGPGLVNIAGAGVSSYFAGNQAAIATQQAYQSMSGLGSTFRQIAVQRAQSNGQLGGSIGGGVLGAIAGGIIGGPMGAGIGFGLGSGAGSGIGGQIASQGAANDPKAVYQDKLVQFQNFRESIVSANSSADVFSAAAQNTGIETGAERELRLRRVGLAASVNEYNRMAGGVAGINKASLALSALEGGTLNTIGGLNGEYGLFRRSMGMSTSEVLSAQIGAISSSGYRGTVSDRLLIGGMQAGYTPGQVGLALSAERSLSTTGLGISGRATLEEANAYGLVGDSANKYMQAKLGFYGSYSDSGVNITGEFVNRTNRFINAGRSAGLRSFKGRAGFARAEEIRTLGERGANNISQMFSGLGGDLLFMQSLIENNGDLTAAYGDLKSLSGQRAQEMLSNVTGGNRDIINFALMGERMSPDLMKVMTGGDVSTQSPRLLRKRLGVDATAAEGSTAQTLAERESKLLSKFDENFFKQISKLDEQIAEAKLANTYLKTIASAFASSKKAVEEPKKAHSPSGKASSYKTNPSAANKLPPTKGNIR